jgi:hypothetical protein
MARPTPFPRQTSSAIVSDDFTAWESNGWVASGDALVVDEWIDTDQITLFSEHAAYWGSNPETEQDPSERSTRVTKTYSGLPGNTRVRVVAGVTFFAQDFGAVGAWVGMEVNGEQYAPNVGPSGTVPGNEGEIVGYGTTSGDGTIEIAFGVDDLGPPSLDLHITFDSIEISTVAADLADIIIDSAVAWMLGNPMSITRGSLTFEPNEEWENYDFPGKTMPVAGLDEVVRSKPVVRGTMMLTGEDQLSMYRPGGDWADADSAGGASVGDSSIRTFTPGQFRSALAGGAYLENFIVIWKRLRGDYLAVEFPVALCTKYGIGSQDGDEGQIGVEIEGRQANDGTPLSSIPYLIHILPSDFEIGA